VSSNRTSDEVDCRRFALGLEAIGALTRSGVRCTTEAHARLTWEREQSRRDPWSRSGRRVSEARRFFENSSIAGWYREK
jgi:hypothetical protein